MKRRNFLSGLLAAPLALKARLAQLFGQSPVNPCAAPRLMLTDRAAMQKELHAHEARRQREICRLLAEGESDRQREIRRLCMRQLALRPSISMSQWAEKAIGRRGPWLN